MKKIIFTLSILLLAGLGSNSTVNAQSINININMDRQPAWGPIGYDYAGYYYFPDLNIYFDINNSLFYYLSGSKWTSNRYLPEKYSKYDFYTMYKVVVNEKQPWLKNSNHKKEYSKYKGYKTQTAIRYSSDNKYNQSKKNTIAWVNNNNHKIQNNNSKNSDKNSTKNNNNDHSNKSNNNKNNNNKSSNNQNKGQQSHR